MPRYYYEDPLEAAYMREQHGVALTITADEDDDYLRIKKGHVSDWSKCAPEYGFSEPDTIGDVIEMLKEDAGPAGVHPDSLTIFRPRVGDLITSHGRKPVLVVEHWTGDFATVDLAQAAAAFDDPRNDAEIVARGGKRFFWPKVEEAV